VQISLLDVLHPRGGKLRCLFNRCLHGLLRNAAQLGFAFFKPRKAPEEVVADAERTRSSGRGLKIISSLLMIVGIIVLMAGASGGGQSTGMIGALMLIGGFFGFVIGRFMD
jgi:hypothetical protein